MLAAAALLDPIHFRDGWQSPPVPIFLVILVGLALDIVAIALTLRLVEKANRRPNLTVAVIAFVIVFAPVVRLVVLNLMPK